MEPVEMDKVQLDALYFWLKEMSLGECVVCLQKAVLFRKPWLNMVVGYVGATTAEVRMHPSRGRGNTKWPTTRSDARDECGRLATSAKVSACKQTF